MDTPRTRARLREAEARQAEAREAEARVCRYLSSGEYIQMSGRAGRRGLDARGTVVTMVDGSTDLAKVREMLRGEADSLSSRFHLSYNMLLNCVRVETVDVEMLIQKSFYTFQQQKALPGLRAEQAAQVRARREKRRRRRAGGWDDDDDDDDEEEEEEEEPAGEVYLDKNNYKRVVTESDDVWLVEYYSGKCGSCQEFLPTWHDVSTSFRDLRAARVNIDEKAGLA